MLCKMCDKKYSVHAQLYMHKKQIHERVKYTCNVCGKQYVYKWDLTKRFKIIHGEAK